MKSERSRELKISRDGPLSCSDTLSNRLVKRGSPRGIGFGTHAHKMAEPRRRTQVFDTIPYRIISNVEVEIAEWHKTTYRPTTRRWFYIASCWALAVALYLAILYDFAFRTETIISLVITLVVAQFFADRAKSWSTSIGRLVADNGADAVPVQVEFTQKDTATGSDFGAIWLENSVLRFKGLETEFELPYAGQRIAEAGDGPTDKKVKTVLLDRTFEVELCVTEAIPPVEDAEARLTYLLQHWSESKPKEHLAAKLPLNIRPKLAAWHCWSLIRRLLFTSAGLGLFAAHDHHRDPIMLVIKYVGYIAIFLLGHLLADYYTNDWQQKLRKNFPDDPSFSNWFVRFTFTPRRRGAKNANL